MPANPDLVERSGELKHSLLEFAHGPRFDRALRQAMRERFGKVIVADEEELINFFDRFLLQHRLADGRTLVEHYVAAHPELPEAEREMLLGWRDVVEGIFVVQGREGEALIAMNLVDELTYRIRSNMGPGAFAPMPVGTFLITRLVPVGDEWLLSGSSATLPASNRAEAYRMAAEAAQKYPALVFRNPDKLAQAWEMQREERHDFIAFFGSDLVVVPGRELAERMRAYMHFLRYEVRDAQGQSADDRAREHYGSAPPVPDSKLPEDLLQAETVGIVYDEVEGFNFFAEFGLLEEAFANPALASDRRHRQVVLGYLRDPSISPLPFRRLAERYPDHASRVFQQVLKKPRFSWERDGEALLRRYKASHFQRPALPSVIPLSEAQARAHWADGSEAASS